MEQCRWIPISQTECPKNRATGSFLMDRVRSRWQISNHKQFACVACHLPETNIVGQVAYKTKAGLNDLYRETLRACSAGIAISAEGLRRSPTAIA